MNAQKVCTIHAPAAIGPYSQAYMVGDFLFVSGQGGLMPESGKIIGNNIKDQAEQTIRNLEAILKQVNTDFSKVVKTTCYLTDMNNFSAFNEVYEKHFISKPARSCVAVKELPLGILCEIELVAYLV